MDMEFFEREGEGEGSDLEMKTLIKLKSRII
jgi:hypothetical protein